MKGLDTNILVRFLVNDDPAQSKVVYNLFQTAEKENFSFFIPQLVLLELLWVLNSVYEIDRNDCLLSLQHLVLIPILKFENLSALNYFINEAKKTKQDLPDLLIAITAHDLDCEKVLTFDKKAAKHNLFELLK